MRLVITGVPGTGKSTLAPLLAKALRVPLFDINEFAKQKGLAKGPQGEVDVDKLEDALNALLRKSKEWIVEGHLACETRLPATHVLVLRCNPDVLRKRLSARHYNKHKLEDNTLSEALDYCLLKAEANYPRAKILQLDFTTPKPAQSVLKLVKQGKSDKVAWTGALFEAAEHSMRKAKS